MIGKRLKDRYEVYSQIGRGGFGEVFFGRDKKTGRSIAVKHLTIIEDESIKHPEEIVKRFEREARICIDSDHPNLVKGYDYGKYEGKPYLVMEYVEGKNLAQYIDNRGALSAEKVVRITKAVLSALSYLYSKGVIAHRDIKPSNVMITVDGRVKLMDLGIVKAITDTVLTRSGQFMGSPHYVSPEQAEGTRKVDQRSDLYSLGVVMYEMATGKVPYDADSTWGILRQHMDPGVKPPKPTSIRSDIPDWLEGVILRVLAKPLSERYQTVQEMARDVERRGVVVEKEEKVNDTGWKEKLVEPIVRVKGGVGKTKIIGPRIRMLWIPGGTFEMGSKDGGHDEKPIHTVTVDGFWMAETVVTIAQYVTFLNEIKAAKQERKNWVKVRKKSHIFYSEGEYKYDDGWGDHPVVNVSWYGAKAFCDYYGLRLPTEAEWEYAAGGPNHCKYPWGNEFDGKGCCYESYRGSGSPPTMPVKSFKPNGYGLYGMAGNVWEWCSDWYGEYYYTKSTSNNPIGPSSGHYKVLRGGSWGSGSRDISSTIRQYYDTNLVFGGYYCSFRCAGD